MCGASISVLVKPHQDSEINDEMCILKEFWQIHEKEFWQKLEIQFAFQHICGFSMLQKMETDMLRDEQQKIVVSVGSPARYQFIDPFGKFCKQTFYPSTLSKHMLYSITGFKTCSET